jgi:hypothetical protein
MTCISQMNYLPDQEEDILNNKNKKQRKESKKKTIAYGLLTRADKGRYGKLIEEIENDFLKGHDDYLKTPTEAYNLLVNYRNYVTVNKRTVIQGGLDQVAFLTDGKNQDQPKMEDTVHISSVSNVTNLVTIKVIVQAK